jgi:S-adenosylmethionine hydrolase
MELDMIVLLTDFGQSEYVGIMKGVIYKIAPDAKIVDLCHDISPQNIIEASWILKNNYMYFPEGAVFCCVVDPGVGTQRKALAVRTEDYYFVAPDNGILWETLKHQRIIEIRQIPVPPDASRTFHGRDVFAKAAVNIDLGNFNEVGEKIKEIEKLELYQNQRQGIVVRIDRFGNIVTNLTKQDKDEYSLQIADRKYVMNFYPDYDSANEGDLFLIEGSCNTLEISLKNGNAVDKLNVKVGEKITIS